MRTALLATAIRTQREETVALLGAAVHGDAAAVEAAAQLAAHLLTVDAALASGRVGTILRIPPEPGPLMGTNPVAGARWQREDPTRLPQLLAGSGQRLARRTRALALLGRVPLRGAAGRWSLRGLAAWHVLDEWVRAGDLDRVADAAADPGDPPLVDVVRGTVLADVLLGTLPRRVLPRIDRSRGTVRLVVELAAAVEGGDTGLAATPRRTWGIDFSRRQYGPRVTSPPDAVVHITAPALVLVAAGRRAWRGLPATALRIDGDRPAATDVLDGIAPVSTEQSG